MGGLPSLGHPVGIVQCAGAVEAETDKELMLGQEAAPCLVQQGAIGRDAVHDPAPRGQVFALLRQELPYAVAVEVEAVRAREDRELIDVEATLYVEKESQKGIVIGAGGKMLKRIGAAARPAIEEMLGTRVFLKLSVKVQEAWRKDPGTLRRLGYTEP